MDTEIVGDEFVDGGDVTTPNTNILPKIPHASTDVWECRVCGYKPNIDKRSGYCISCGRDFWGNPGQIPPDDERDPRAGIRSDGR